MIFDKLVNKLNTGEKIGITSICSANKFVIEAAMHHAKKNNYDLLIESTSNQVDQFGGYTGMTPSKFKNYVTTIANEINFPIEKLALGGDHLGPNVWKKLNSDEAMKNAEEQITAYISAGYTKIHLDTSFVLADDKHREGILSPEIICERAAQLCETAEQTFKNENKNNSKPIYIIGTDVPIPGGAIDNDEKIMLTSASDLEQTVELTKKEFYKRGLEDAWERVIAVVVQPGVEFSDSKVLPYSREKNSDLIKKIEEYEKLYFEAHSTDYQKIENLKNMVQDNFAILKVGPWLTFALREALYSLAYIEEEIFKNNNNSEKSNLRNVLEKEMNDNPKYWEGHYNGNETEIYLAQNFSYSDRIRYYWTNTTVDESVNKLLQNLEIINIPESLISQFMPNQYQELREGIIKNNPRDFVRSKITKVLDVYQIATGGKI